MEEKFRNDERINMMLRPAVLVSSDNKTETALMDEAHMEGLVMQKCSAQDIRYSNAFMVATLKESEEPTDKYYKIQDKVFFNAFSKICCKKNFCTKALCWRNDAIAAEFIMEQDIAARSEYKGMINIRMIESPDKERKGIHYICPLTQLDEIAVPVRLCDHPMGVLIVGQISTPENRLELEECIRNKMPAERTEVCTESAEDVIKKIEVEYDLDELIRKVFITVEDIEKGLRECYVERQNQYVLKMSSQLILGLKNDVESERAKKESLNNLFPAAEHIEQYEFIGTCIRKQLKTLCDTIGISDVEIFIPTGDNLVSNAYGELISGDVTFYFDRWMKIHSHRSGWYEDLDQYIDLKERKYDLLVVAPAFTYPIAMAVNSTEFLCDVAERERGLLKQTFCDTFCKFAEYAQMIGMEAKSDYYRVYLDNYTGIQRHELGQTNAGYQMLIEEFRKNRIRFGEKINEMELLPEDYGSIGEYLRQCDHFIADSESYLHTTLIRIQSTKYLIDFTNAEKKYFYPYDVFLFKWKQIYGKRAEDAYINFRFPRVIFSDYTRPRMYGDPSMIEQAAYNLTNNAIKYALPGTTVSLDCSLNSNRDRYEITVENIGRPFESEAEKDSIFHFGRRGSNNKKQGSGLGLFLTQQIAKAHGGNVTCETERLSEFNWTLLHLYIKYFELKSLRLCKDEKLYYQLMQESKVKQDDIKKYITKEIEDNAFTPMYVHQNIRSGTARFKFTFWIPYDGD